VAIVLPLIIAAYEFYFATAGRRYFLRVLTYLSPLILLSFLYYWLYVLVPLVEVRLHAAPTNIYMALKALAYYLRYLVFPVGLSAEHSLFWSASFFEWPSVLSVVVFISFLGAIIFFFRRDKIISFALAWIFITWLPVSNLFLHLSYYFAERYLYAPSFGICLIFGRLAALFSDTKVIRYKKAAALLFPALIVLFSANTVTRNTDWKDSVSLWSDAAKKSPNSAYAYYNLGAAYQNEVKDYSSALLAYRQAAQLKPDMADAYLNIGVIHYMQGNYGKARDAAKKLLEIDASSKEGRILLQKTAGRGL